MADKTVNVNIKYNVDTSQIQRAQAASQAAQRATDNLRKATDEYGKASTTANKAAQEAIKKTSHDVGTLTKDFNGLYTSIRAIVTAGLAKELIDATLNMARLSGQVEGVTKAFNRIPNATLLLQDLRNATHGTVTDLNLMQKALTAQNFRIPLENLGTLLEFAAVKAQQTGQEVNHLVDYIVSGIGYRSIKRLDDLGFTANRVKEALGGVSLQAASMSQVMAALTKLMNEDLAKTGGYAETAATQVGHLETAIHELNVEVSQAGTNRGVIKFFTDVVTVTRQAIKAGMDYADVVLLFTNPSAFAARKVLQAGEVATQEKLLELANQQALAFTKRNQAAEEGDRVLNTDKELYNLSQTVKLYEQDQQFRESRTLVLKEEIQMLEEKNRSVFGLQKLSTEEAKQISLRKDELKSITDSNEALANNKKIVEEVIKLLVDYRATISTGENPSDGLLGIIEQKKAEIEALEDQIEKTRNRGDLGISGNLTVALAKARKELKELNESSTEFYNDYLAHISDMELATSKKILEGRRETAEREKENLKRSADLFEYFYNLKAQKAREIYEEEIYWAEARADKEREIREELSNFSFQQASNLINSELQREIDGYSMRINALKDFYDIQIGLAGDNERAKKELRVKEDREVQQLEKERADREKKAAQAGILVNTALAVIKVFAGEGTYVDKIIRAAIVAGEGATQYAIASRARYYAKGEINIKGPGTETSDSIPAMLSKGESIMTAKQTREAFGILTDIRAGRLNDRIIKQITTNGGVAVMDDTRIVDELRGIRKNKAPDLVKQGRQIYEVYTSQAGNKRFIRSKSI